MIAAAASVLLQGTQSRAGDPVEVGHVLGLRSPAMTKDYRIALELMMKRVFAGFGVDISMNAFETPEEALDAFWRGKIDVTEISSLDYALLPEEKRKKMEIVGVVNLAETKFKRYALMAKPGTTLEQLEGEPIHVVGRGDWNAGKRWLEIEIGEKFGKSAAEYFGEITVVDFEDPNEAVLPTFFGKSKACLVMEHQIDLLAELNPQIAVRLKPMKVSPQMLGVIFAIRADYEKHDIEKLKVSTEKLHTTPDGQQAFTLMKVVRMSRGSEEDLGEMHKLVKRIEALDKAYIASLPTGIEHEGDK